MTFSKSLKVLVAHLYSGTSTPAPRCPGWKACCACQHGWGLHGASPGLPQWPDAWPWGLGPGLGRAGQAVWTSHLKAGVLCPYSGPTSPSLAQGDLHVGSGNGRQAGVWKLGPAACWASGREASGVLRIAPDHASELPAGSCASPVPLRVPGQGASAWLSMPPTAGIGMGPRAADSLGVGCFLPRPVVWGYSPRDYRNL